MTEERVAERPAAVISAHRPDHSFEANLQSVGRQAAFVIVVDDSGQAGPLARRVATLGLPNVSVVENPNNLGLARSLNRGIERAVAQGARSVMTFDQDTAVPPGFIDALARFMARQGPDVVAVGPETIDHERQPVYHRHGGEVCSLRILQSGMLVSAAAFAKVGGFREEFYIDVLEPDFLARAHRAGFHSLLAPGTDLPHVVGAPRRVNLWLVSPKVSDHAVFRRYLMTRNGLVVAVEAARSMPRFAVDIARGVWREAWRAILLEHSRRAKLRAVLLGVRDALRRRLGPPPPSVPRT